MKSCDNSSKISGLDGPESTLSNSEEAKWIQYKTNPNKKLQNYFVKQNEKLVFAIARSFARRSRVPLEDLIQEGNIGLLKAIEKYDVTRGFRFSTYATWWIRQAIGNSIARDKSLIRTPAHAIGIKRKLSKITGEIDEPSDTDLTELTGYSKKMISAAKHGVKGIVSIDANVPGTDEPLSTILIDHSRNPEQETILHQIQFALKEAFSSLSDREEAVIRMRYNIWDDII